MNTAWDEYDSAADWCAARGYDGKRNSPLPMAISRRCIRMILADIDAFSDRVKACAYARAMNATHRKYAARLPTPPRPPGPARD